MTVNTTTITSGPYTGNGLSDTYAYTFRVEDKTQLKVYETTDADVQTLLVVDIDYTVNGIGVDAGGTIVRAAGNLPSNYTWYIKADYPETQLTEFPSQGPFLPETHEKALDHVTFLIQQLRDSITDRIFRLSDTIPIDGVFTIAQDAATRAYKTLTFDSNGDLTSLAFSISTLADSVVVNNKTAAASLVLTSADAGRKIFITSDDGGEFTVRYNVTPGTYADDSSSFCGAIFIPSGGDGTIGIERNIYRSINISAYGGSPSAAAAVNVNSVKEYLAGVVSSNAYQCVCSAGVYNFDARVVEGATMPEGVQFIGARGGGLDSADGTVFKSSYAGILFDIKEPNGVESKGNWVWENITFECTNVAGGALGFNDITVAMTDTSASPNYIRRIGLKNCAFWGEGSNSVTGNAIQGLGVFELVIDHLCEFRGWKRAVYLKGCDNCNIDGRFVLNVRHIMSIPSNTFGGQLHVNARFLGIPITAGVETASQLWIETHGAKIDHPDLEGGCAGGMLYLNGEGIYINYPDFGGGTAPNNVAIKLGPDAIDCHMESPRYSGGPGPVIVIDNPTSTDWGGTFQSQALTILNPSTRFEQYIFTPHPGIKVINQVRMAGNIPTHSNLQVTSNGVAIRNAEITAFNIDKLTSSGMGYVALDNVLADSATHRGYVLQTTTANLSGAGINLTVGEHINEGDSFIATYRYKLAGVPSSGTFRWIWKKNGANVSNGDLGSSTSYTNTTPVKYTLSGFVDGDILNIGFYNSGMDVKGLIESVSIIVFDATANADTSGATLGQLETEVNELKATLRTAGLIG